MVYTIGTPFSIVSSKDIDPSEAEHGKFIMEYINYWTPLHLAERNIDDPKTFALDTKRELEEKGAKVQYIKVDGSRTMIHYSASNPIPLIVIYTICALALMAGLIIVLYYFKEVTTVSFGGYELSFAHVILIGLGMYLFITFLKRD